MADPTPVIIQPKPTGSSTYIAMQIGPGTIIGSQIADDTITTENVDDISGAKLSSGTVTGDKIDGNTITGDNIESLEISGKTIEADTGTIGGWTLGATELAGPVGAIIRSGQTDFTVGTGFWLGNVAGTPKFSIGTTAGNQMSWDGTNLRVTGNFTPTTVFNTYTYATADLPVPPTAVGFNDPAGNE